MSLRQTHSKARGQAIVEFSLTLPILILVVMGIYDFSRAIWYYNTLAEAAREGTRYAMVHGSSSSSPVGPGSGTYTAPNLDTTVQAVVRGFAFGMDSSQVSVLSTWPDGDNRAGHRANVEVRYTYSPVTGVFLGGASVILNSISEALIVY